MKAFLKPHLGTILFFTLVGLIGGFCVGLYLLDSYPKEIQNQLISELNAAGISGIPISIFTGIVTALQSAGYGLVAGGIGIFLAKKIGLWRDERKIEMRPLLITILIACFGGLALILPDVFFFGHHSDAIMNSYATKPTVFYLLATVTYGAVIEEVLLRLFAMSLIAFILHKLFSGKRETPSPLILILANVIAALLFAAGHLPATFLLIGNSPMILFRCFLLNGGLGLLFGYLYRKHGLRYAMIAHGGCHVVSKLIWILFL